MIMTLMTCVLSVVKHEVVGVIGEAVAVPCNCTPSHSQPGDRPALILWYKDRANLPIYRYDGAHVIDAFSSLHFQHFILTNLINQSICWRRLQGPKNVR